MYVYLFLLFCYLSFVLYAALGDHNYLENDFYCTRECQECLLFMTHLHECDKFIQTGTLNASMIHVDNCNNQRIKIEDWSEQYNSQRNLTFISVGHHGFGNQLFEHTFAYLLGNAYNANVLIKKQTRSFEKGIDTLKNKNIYHKGVDSNTNIAAEAISYLLPKEVLLDNNINFIDACQYEKTITFPLGGNLSDWRRLIEASSKKPVCIRLWSFWQLVALDLPPYFCRRMVVELWKRPLMEYIEYIAHDRYLSNDNENVQKPGSNDMAIYLRCAFYTYEFEDVSFYERILDTSSYEKLYVYEAPECNHVHHKHHFYQRYMDVHSLFVDKYKAVIHKSDERNISAKTLLLDFYTLINAGKIILASSTWCFWVAIFSSATEIHTNPFWGIMYPPDLPIIYHNSKGGQFYGHYDTHSGRIIY
jgi:hypothetical protein